MDQPGSAATPPPASPTRSPRTPPASLSAPPRPLTTTEAHAATKHSVLPGASVTASDGAGHAAVPSPIVGRSVGPPPLSATAASPVLTSLPASYSGGFTSSEAPPLPPLTATATASPSPALGAGSSLTARQRTETAGPSVYTTRETNRSSAPKEEEETQPWWATAAFAAPSRTAAPAGASPSATADSSARPASSASGPGSQGPQGRRVIRARALSTSPTHAVTPAFPLVSSEMVHTAKVTSPPPPLTAEETVLRHHVDPARSVGSGSSGGDPQRRVAARQAQRREALPPLLPAPETSSSAHTIVASQSSGGPVNLFAKKPPAVAVGGAVDNRAPAIVAYASKGDKSADHSRASTPTGVRSPASLRAYSMHPAGRAAGKTGSDSSTGFGRIRATLQSSEQAVRATAVSSPGSAPLASGGANRSTTSVGSKDDGGSRYTAGSWNRGTPLKRKKDAEDVEYTFTVMESSSGNGDRLGSRSADETGSRGSGSRTRPLAKAPNGGVWENPFGTTGGRAGTNSSATPLNIWAHEGGFLRSIFGNRNTSDKGGEASDAKSAQLSASGAGGGDTRGDRGILFAQEGNHLTSLFATEVQPAHVDRVSRGGRSAAGSGGGGSVSDRGLGEPRLSPRGAIDKDGKEGGNSFPSGNGDDNDDDDGGDSVIAREKEREAEEEIERIYAARAFRTRNLNALRAYTWDQRVYLPVLSGWLASPFGLFASPRFWEKLDWSLRASVLTIFPTLVLCMEEATRHWFPLPTSVVAYAFWISQPTLGAGLRELFVVLKGFSVGLVALIIFIAINPGPPWLSLLILFAAILVGSFIAEGMKRTLAYVLCSLVMQYVSNPAVTTYKYVGDYFLTLLIALGFGLAAFFVPYIRWSSDVASHYLGVAGDSISLAVRGLCGCFWTRTPLERQLHLARIRQLQATVELSLKKAGGAVSEMGYEPHSGVYTSHIKTRMAFIKSIFNVIKSMTLVIDMISDNPSMVDTAMCNAFGARIRSELAIIGAAMDATLLKIADLKSIITQDDIERFKAARDRYEDAVSRVREEVILNNDDYRTDHSDVLLGFYLFSIEELCDLLSGFKENSSPPNNLVYLLTFPIRDLRSSMDAFQAAGVALVRRYSLTRRLKEAIKLSACIIIAAYFQVYGMKNSSTSPVAGVDIIALVYKPTGAESFQYATNRLLGTVLGSLTGLLGVQIADGRHAVLYTLAVVLCFIGCWVQAAPGYFPLGNAMCNSVISIVIQFRDPSRAMVRIQQNCFAILTYFVISSVIWPMRARTKVHLNFDISMRMYREAVSRLLQNLDMPESGTEVSSDALSLIGEMGKKVGVQAGNLSGASAEPTLDSAEFPEMPWRGIIDAQQKLNSTLLMMRYAYNTFMTSTVGTGLSLSVHWVILHRIAPYAHELSELVYAACDIYLLALTKATVVPTAHLSRIRHGMIRCQRKIILTYISTIQREVQGDSDSRDDDSFDEENDDDEHKWSDSEYGGGGQDGDFFAQRDEEFNIGLRTPVGATPSMGSRRRGSRHGRVHSAGASLTSANVAKLDGGATGGKAAATEDKEGGATPSGLRQRRHRRRGEDPHMDGSTPATTAAAPAPAILPDLAAAPPASVRKAFGDVAEAAAALGDTMRAAPKGATTTNPTATAAAAAAAAVLPAPRPAAKRKGGYLAYRLRPEEQEALRTMIGNASFLDPSLLTNNSIVRIPAEYTADTATNRTAPSVRERERAQEAERLGSVTSRTDGTGSLASAGVATASQASDFSGTYRGAPPPVLGNQTFAGPGLGLSLNNSIFLGRPGATLANTKEHHSLGGTIGGAGVDLFDVRPLQRKNLAAVVPQVTSTSAPGKGVVSTALGGAENPLGMPQPAGTMTAVTPVNAKTGGLTHGELLQHERQQQERKAHKQADADKQGGAGGSAAAHETRGDGASPLATTTTTTAAAAAPAEGPTTASSADDNAAPLITVTPPQPTDPQSEEAGAHQQQQQTQSPSADSHSIFSDGSAPVDRGDSSHRKLSGGAALTAEVPHHFLEESHFPDAPSIPPQHVTDQGPHEAYDELDAGPHAATHLAGATNNNGSIAPSRPNRLSSLLARVGKRARRLDGTASEASEDPGLLSQTLVASEIGAGRAAAGGGGAAGAADAAVTGAPGVYSDDSSYSYSDSGSPSSRMGLLNPDQVLDNLSFFDADRGEFVLTNRDIHSLEAFLFGIRVLVLQMDEMEKHILAMIHSNEMAQKL